MTELDAVTTINNYLRSVREARSENTARAYSTGLWAFLRVLEERGIKSTAPASIFTEDQVTWMLAYLRVYSSTTERLYLQAVKGFYQYLAAEKICDINLPRLYLIIRNRARRPGQRLPQFAREGIEKILEYVNKNTSAITDESKIRLRAYRDRAYLLTLADTGLRVHEVCNLRRGDLDWNESRAVIVGKGNKQSVVRFSSRCIEAIKEYLSARAALDGASGRSLPSLPLFARHDRGAGKKIKPITTATGRNIVKEYVVLALGKNAEKNITPHSFRHYFVTTVLRSSGNLKLAQELARHASIQVTQRYAHLSNDELDKGYHEIFEKGINSNKERTVHDKL